LSAVMEMEAASRNIFWGLVVKPGKRYETEVQEPFRITKACIEPSTAGSGVSSVIIECDNNEEFIVANLNSKILNENLDLAFNEGEKICFKVDGPGSVHLTGNLMEDPQDPNDTGDMPFDMMGSSEEESDTEEAGDRIDEVLDIVSGKRKKKEIDPAVVAKKAKIEEAEESDDSNDETFDDEADEDDDEDEEESDDDEAVEGDSSNLVDEETTDDDEMTEEAELATSKVVKKKGEKAERKNLKAELKMDDEVEAKKQKTPTKTPKAEVKSPKAEAKTPKAETKTPKAEAKADNAVTKTPKAEAKAAEAKTPKASKTPKADAKTPKAEAKAPIAEAKTPKAEAKALNAEAKTPKTEAKTPKAEAKALNAEAKTPKAEAKTPKAEAKTPKADPKTPKAVEGDSASAKPTVTPGKTPKRTLKGGVQVEELKEGTGQECRPGNMVGMFYAGRLKSTNKQFDACLAGDKPFKFKLGSGQVIKGWDLGVLGMKVGGKRRLTVPAAMGYGKDGSPPDIPPNSVLVFDVECKFVK
jgi:FK506-binding nuclear protein